MVESWTVEEALSVLGEASIDHHTRVDADHFLAHLDPVVEVPQLVDALTSDNFKIRWEAAKRLKEMGQPGLKGILYALVDPHRVGDPRLRNGVYHVLRNHPDAAVRRTTGHLLKDLHGSAADLKTMYEAHRLLLDMIHHSM